MKRPALVCMLPTDKPFEWHVGQIVKRADNTLDISTHNVFRADAPALKQCGQHLYFTTDEAKKGEWGICQDGVGIYEGIGYIDGYNRHICAGNYYRTDKYAPPSNIVATTNSELWDRTANSDKSKIITDTRVYKIPQSFITAYISAYNAGTPIKEVMLEYYEYDSDPGGYHIVLKLNSDGSVIWSVKEKNNIFSREKALNMLLEAKTFMDAHSNPCRKTLIDWFDKNYPR